MRASHHSSNACSTKSRERYREPRGRPFEAQIAAINLVQRHGREVLCYTTKCWRVNRKGVPAFPNRAPELWFASATCTLPGNRTIGAKLWATGGHFCSVVFNTDRATFGKDVEPIDTTAQILQDVTNVGARTPPSATLPRDYLEFVGDRDEVKSDAYTVLGRKHTYEVVLDDGDYHVLAEVLGKGTIAMRQGAPELYFLEIDNVPPVPLGTSLTAALRSVAESD